MKILAFLTLILAFSACGDKKTPNLSLVGDEHLEAQQKAHDEIRAELKEAGIDYIEEYNEDGKLIEIKILPEDLSYFEAKRIQALRSLKKHLSDTVKNSKGKTVKKNGKTEEVLEDSEKDIQFKAIKRATLLIEHFEKVQQNRKIHEGRFIEHAEYLRLTKEARKLISELEKDLKEKHAGIVYTSFAPEMALLDEVPKFGFTDKALISFKKEALKNINKTKSKFNETLNQLMDQHAVVSEMKFVTFNDDHKERAEELFEQINEALGIIKRYENSLSETAENQLKENSKFKLLAPENVEDNTESLKVPAFATRYTEPNEKARALDRFINDVDTFIKTWNDEDPEDADGLEISFLNSGEKTYLEKSKGEARDWAQFYLNMVSEKNEFLTLDVFAAETMKAWKDKQNQVWAEAAKSGIKISSNIPIAEIDGQPVDIYSRPLKLILSNNYEKQGLVPVFCFLLKFKSELLEPLVANSVKVHITPNSSLSFDNKQLERANSALSLVTEKASGVQLNCSTEEETE